jgi:transcriptional regulator with XRE-family HTH domain
MVYPVSPLEIERRRRGKTQWQVARETNIVQSRLSLIERGYVKPRPEEAQRIASCLGMPETDLFPDGVRK